jgi:hypothetical protein
MFKGAARKFPRLSRTTARLAPQLCQNSRHHRPATMEMEFRQILTRHRFGAGTPKDQGIIQRLAIAIAQAAQARAPRLWQVTRQPAQNIRRGRSTDPDNGNARRGLAARQRKNGAGVVHHKIRRFSPFWQGWTGL